MSFNSARRYLRRTKRFCEAVAAGIEQAFAKVLGVKVNALSACKITRIGLVPRVGLRPGDPERPRPADAVCAGGPDGRGRPGVAPGDETCLGRNPQPQPGGQPPSTGRRPGRARIGLAGKPGLVNGCARSRRWAQRRCFKALTLPCGQPVHDSVRVVTVADGKVGAGSQSGSVAQGERGQRGEMYKETCG